MVSTLSKFGNITGAQSGKQLTKSLQKSTHSGGVSENVQAVTLLSFGHRSQNACPTLASVLRILSRTTR